MRALRLFLLAIATLYCSVMFDAVPANAADAILFEGDSQTSPRAPVTAEQTYAALVSAQLGRPYVNYAVPGSKASDVIARLPGELSANPGASCVMVMIGANDAFIDPDTYMTQATASEWAAPLDPPASRTSVGDFEAQIVTIVSQIRAAGRNPVLLTPWAVWSTPNLVQFPWYVNRMKDVGARLGVPVIDAYHIQPDLYWNIGNTGLAALESDYQHPSAEGHARIAALILSERYKLACVHHP
jgi:lysophospholipase L1-like esterase